jgi:hypothetical protein
MESIRTADDETIGDCGQDEMCTWAEGYKTPGLPVDLCKVHGRRRSADQYGLFGVSLIKRRKRQARWVTDAGPA